MEISAPTRGNRKLEALLAAANADERLRAWWHMEQVNAETLLGIAFTIFGAAQFR